MSPSDIPPEARELLCCLHDPPMPYEEIVRTLGGRPVEHCLFAHRLLTSPDSGLSMRTHLTMIAAARSIRNSQEILAKLQSCIDVVQTRHQKRTPELIIRVMMELNALLVECYVRGVTGRLPMPNTSFN